MGVFKSNNAANKTSLSPYKTTYFEELLPELQENADPQKNEGNSQELMKLNVEVAGPNRSKDGKDAQMHNAEETANWFSKMTFSFYSSIFKRSQQKGKLGEELEMEDFFTLQAKDEARVLYGKFNPLLNEGIAKGYNGARLLFHCIYGIIGRTALLCVLILFLRSGVRLVYPVLLNQFLAYVSGENEGDVWEGYVIAGLMALDTIVATILRALHDHWAYRTGINMRSVLSTAIFRKTLRLTQSSRSGTTTGEIINYMQLDTARIEQYLESSTLLFSSLAELLLFTGMAIYFIGYAALVGLAIMVIGIPLNKYLVSKLYAIDKVVVTQSDERVKLTNEAIQGILGVKTSAWEEKFISRINVLRSNEVKSLKGSRIYDALFEMTVGALPAFTAACAIATYAIAQDGVVSASILFTTVVAFDRVRQPLIQLPNIITAILQALTSARRLTAFFLLPEIDMDSGDRTDDESLEDGVDIEVVNGTFYWSAEPPKRTDNDKEDKSQPPSTPEEEQSAIPWVPVLRNISIKFQEGKCTSVVGPVGSGKSALVQALLGEMYCASGEVKQVKGTPIAYCDQDPWVLNATILENILFGEPLDNSRLKAVVKVCQLEHDIKLFPAGLSTMIGEKGINLSGGQKARLCIARAAYSSSKVVIMDNPLSALDPGVAGRLFDECINGFMHDRTRILVTNQLHILKHCDWIVVLQAPNAKAPGLTTELESKSGMIQEQGTYNSLKESGLEFSVLLAEFLKAGRRDQEIASPEENIDSTQPLTDPGVVELEQTRRESRAANSFLEEEVNAGKNFMTTEERGKGAVDLMAYRQYILACGGWFAFFGVILLSFSTRGAGFLGLKWVSLWTEAAASNYSEFDLISVPTDDDTASTAIPLLFYALGYIGATILDLLFTFLTSYALLTFCLNGSVRIHEELLKSVFGGNMEFFDTTPIGRIMNRFSKDIAVLDRELPFSLSFFLLAVPFSFTALIILTSIIPWYGLAIIPLGAVYFRILHIYRPVSRDVKRLESISRSPVFAHFSETIAGTPTIRAYKASDRFQETSMDLIDRNAKVALIRSIQFWLALRLEVFGAISIAVVGFLAVQGTRDGWLSPGDTGVAFQYADMLAVMLQFAIFSYSNLEAAMTNAERIFYYRDNVPQEPPREADSTDNSVVAAPAEWPTAGALQVNELKMRYREDSPLVLKGVSFSVKAGQRVGICGRTGSGKSSLIKSLMRLVEPETVEGGKEGPVFIDGVDISHLGLGPLRRAISIVSQDPTIFSGTIRMNLDPFGEHQDVVIWESLEKCGLKELIQESPDKLDMKVAEFGTNLSQGQRQLLVLARCLVGNSKILLLDESTASLDFETDAKIQKAIRTTFTNCTILVIAHRIRTILDSDMILVMDDGRVAEYGSPSKLLENKEGLFAEMCRGQNV